MIFLFPFCLVLIELVQKGIVMFCADMNRSNHMFIVNSKSI